MGTDGARKADIRVHQRHRGREQDASLSPDQYELNEETFMTASARISGRSGPIRRAATERRKQAKNAAFNSSDGPVPAGIRPNKQRSRLTNGTALLPDATEHVRNGRNPTSFVSVA